MGRKKRVLEKPFKVRGGTREGGRGGNVSKSKPVNKGGTKKQRGGGGENITIKDDEKYSEGKGLRL